MSVKLERSGGQASMAFVPKYRNDIFVSYARIDDQPYLDTDTKGWVSTLVHLLKLELGQKIGRPDACKIWFDSHELRGNETLVSEIKSQVTQSAAFVAILSAGYIEAAWCIDELRLFMRRFGHELGKRVFLIEKVRIDFDNSTPQEVRRLISRRERLARRGYRFWYIDQNNKPRTFAVPVPRKEEQEYFREIEDLALDLKIQLKTMKLGESRESSRVSKPRYRPLTGKPNSGATHVLLAEVNDDLEFRRREVRRYLEQHGVIVLPTKTLPVGRTEFEAALDRDLARSRLFVQLLGEKPSKGRGDPSEQYDALQFNRARQQGLPVMQWRSPEMDLGSVKCARHRGLLELETVRATSLESFKRAVVEAIRPRQAQPSLRAAADRPLIFLNTAPQHRAVAAQIRKEFGRSAVWVEPLHEGPSEDVRTDLEQNLIACDAMVIVYADNVGWVRAQLRTFLKLAPLRDRGVRAIAVLDLPADEKPELGFELSELVIIDGRDGIGAPVLNKLWESIRL